MLIEFLRDPIGWMKEKWAELTNWFGTALGAGVEFDEMQYENRRTNPTICISQEDFESMKSNLETMLNRNVAGLDDIMLKKMLLTYYKGTFLDDTTVLIELTKEDLNIDEFTWNSYMDHIAQKDGVDLLVNMTTEALIRAAVFGMVGRWSWSNSWSNKWSCR